MSSPDVSAVSIAQLYDDHVADHYDDDAFGIIARSRSVALEQLDAAVPAPRRVCDFGMGTGDCLLELRRAHPNAALWGVDVSARMIERARAKFSSEVGLRELTFLHGDASESRDLLPPEPMDVAVTHFLLNYVDDRKMAKRVHATLNVGGVWSIVTSVRDSFPALAELARRFLPPESQPHLHTRVPEEISSVETLVTECGFDIIDQRALEHPLVFLSFDALVHFARHSGWFTSEALARFTAEQTEELRPALSEIFPLHDVARVAVLLCRKR